MVELEGVPLQMIFLHVGMLQRTCWFYGKCLFANTASWPI